MDELCRPKEFQLQEHQNFLKRALFSLNKRLLLFHGLGSGKTCSALSIINAFLMQKKKKSPAKVLVITPASIKPNIYKEMMGPCGKQFDTLRNQSRISMRAEIDKLIRVISYQEFVNIAKRDGFNFTNTMVIVDEVQNIISATGSTYKRFLYEFVQNPTNNNTDMRLVLLSGTPIFDQPFEIALLGNLLRKNKDKLKMPDDPKSFNNMYKFNQEDGTITNDIKFAKYFKGKVSYFRGASPAAYPRRRNHDVMCPMHPFQYKTYRKTIGSVLTNGQQIDDISQAFLIGPRMASNVVYPNGKIDLRSALQYHGRAFQPNKYSAKFTKCIEHIMGTGTGTGTGTNKGTMFVYSNFVRACGIDTFARFLKTSGFEQVIERVHVADPTKDGMRYAIFRTGEPELNTRILDMFNSYENRDGKLIKVILGSPAMKEGVTLLRVSQVHLLDPYWNQSREEQVIGRAIRFCSHKDVAVKKQVVDVYKYYATHPTSTSTVSDSDNSHSNNKKSNNKISNNKMTVDTHVRAMSLSKKAEIDAFERVIKESAFDCNRFKSFNEPPSISCRFSNNNNNNNNIRNGNKNRKKKTNHVSSSIINMVRRSMLKNKQSRDATNIKKPPPILRELKIGGVVRRQLVGGVSKKVNGVKKESPIIQKSTDGRSTSTYKCPPNRRPNPNCPNSHPHIRLNKYGAPCCYKRSSRAAIAKERDQTDATSMKPKPKCVTRFTKDVLKKMAINKQVYQMGPVTKRRLCELLNLH
jgi:superfamily II DNA or RNA helicase